ncbi:hypothetical protein H4R18_003639 [Coemansia javaensis]|uniref:Galactose oxidase n=1 Tax=Coemansia javaensis TaxID=2761396 RepID=A0A9W8H9T9_9FUNG|nr:hypothetical protein H4R18_003639 [Coemansia javaensis]
MSSSVSPAAHGARQHQHHQQPYVSKPASATDLAGAYSPLDGTRTPLTSPPRAVRPMPPEADDDGSLVLQAAVAGMAIDGGDVLAAAQAQRAGSRAVSQRRPAPEPASRPHTSTPQPAQQIAGGGGIERASRSRAAPHGTGIGAGPGTGPGAGASAAIAAPAAALAAAAAEPRAPTPAMYWSRRAARGAAPPKMRSQTMTAVGSKLYVFGGWNNSVCYSDVHVLDTETMFWSRMATTGDAVPPCRAHTATAVGHRLFVFGGGDGTQYFSDLYVLDTQTCAWARAAIAAGGPQPAPRRTHTCFHYGGYVYLFGGGDGHRALNDLWRVRAEPDAATGEYRWEEVETSNARPFPRGYHTSTLVGNQVVVFGGSDGNECFGDTSLLNLDTLEWSHVAIDPPLTRLAHSATLVGMYLFVICGHDGSDYSNQVLMLKLDTLKWETRAIYGSPPAARGYHACALHDGRLFLHGGYNGQEVFDDLHTLELSSYSYLPQVPEFVIGCHR